MRLPAYSSDHPEVLATWAELEAQTKRWYEVCDQIKTETGRDVMVGTGWGDDHVLGLTCKYTDPPPVGWRWDDTRKRSYIRPRAKGPGTADAQTLMKRLEDALVRPRSTLQDKYGMPAYVLLGLTCRTPGLHLMGDKLWVYYGEGELDKPWDGGDCFTPQPLSAYHAACEAEEGA